MKLVLALCFFMVATIAARGTSIVFPTYSTPILANDTIVILSPDGTRLLGVSNKGEQKWKRQLSTRGSVFKHKSGKVLVIEGSSVSVVNPANGAMTPWFAVKLPGVNLSYRDEGDLYYGKTEALGVPSLAVYDGSTHAFLLTEERGETVAYADDGVIVLAKGKRKYADKGYSYSKGWLEGYDRKTKRRIWIADFKNQPWPYHDICRVGDYLVCEDGGNLMVIHAVRGDLHRSSPPKPKDSIGPSGLRNENGALVYVTTEMNISDFHRSKHTVYRLRVPELTTIETKVVEVIEAARVETVGEFMISDSLYRTACFRRDGRKVWEHFQMHRTGVIDGLIYFSDYNNGVAQMGTLEVSTGKKRILISEKVKMDMGQGLR